MSAPKATLLQFIVIGVVGIIAGLTVNTVRAKNNLDLTKNYFDKTSHRQTDGETPQLRDAGAQPTQSQEGDVDPESTQAVKAPTDAGDDASDSPRSSLPEHDYQTIPFDEVQAVFEDPNTAAGGNLFVDARSETVYGDGHIPGAYQLDPYRIGNYEADYLDFIVQSAEGADKVVVYCNGGDCEDSIYACRELIQLDVPYDKVYLYQGGYKEWKNNGMPVESGKGY
jgi:rhodanese-related sulfurtransferase